MPFEKASSNRKPPCWRADAAGVRPGAGGTVGARLTDRDDRWQGCAQQRLDLRMQLRGRDHSDEAGTDVDNRGLGDKRHVDAVSPRECSMIGFGRCLMSMDFTFNFNQPRGSARSRPKDDEPFRILVMGDFSGGTREASTAQVLTVDIDNFDDVMQRLQPSVELTINNEDLTLAFGDLEAFHPDEIFEQASLFDHLKSLRAQLKNPATFESAAAEVRSWGRHDDAKATTTTESTEATPASPTKDDATESVEDTLQRLLGSRASTPASGSAPQTTRSTTIDITGMIRDLVAPHIVPDAHPGTDELVGVVDEAMSVWMRAILHDPKFRAIESVWRAVHFLITNLETDESLQIQILDVSLDAMRHDLKIDDISQSALFKTLAEDTMGSAGGKPLAVIVGHYTFNKNLEDIATLLRMSAVAAAAGAPFLTHGGASFVGLDSFHNPPDCNDWNADGSCDADVSQAWNAFRMSPASRAIALTMPRIASRLPYGPKTDPVSVFAFEELPPATLADPHEAFPWTGGATACACLLGQAFSEQGWDLPASASGDVSGLPVYITVDRHGDRAMQPIAEAWLPDRAGQRLQDEGFVPILSIQNRDAIRVVSIQSIAKSDARLLAKWVH